MYMMYMMLVYGRIKYCSQRDEQWVKGQYIYCTIQMYLFLENASKP